MRTRGRRRFDRVLLGLGALAGCAGPAGDADAPTSGERHRWRMVTSWPPNFPGFGESALRLARRIEQLSGGRLAIEVYAAAAAAMARAIARAVYAATAEDGDIFPVWSSRTDA